MLARIELAGEVSGIVNGAACRLDVKGKCRFDRRRGRIDWFAMLVGDRREPGAVEDGMDVKARLQIKISPTPASNPLADAVLRGLTSEPTPELCRLLCEGADGGWLVKHDRQWFLCENRREAAVLRLMAQGTDVAQCNIAPWRGFLRKNSLNSPSSKTTCDGRSARISADWSRRRSSPAT